MDYEYFDYKTGKVNGNDIFDTSTTGNDAIDVLKNPTYFRVQKNKEGKIVQMSPREYFYGCAKIFNSTFEDQVKSIAWEKDYNNHLKSVLTIKGDKFPMTYLNFADETQEGRHRMFVAGELFGWDTKFPVLVIEHADKERAQKDEEDRKKAEIEHKVERALQKALDYKYNDFQEFVDELQMQLDGMFYSKEDIEFDIGKDIHDKIHIQLQGVDVVFDPSEIKYEIDDDYYENQLDITDLDDDDYGTISSYLTN